MEEEEGSKLMEGWEPLTLEQSRKASMGKRARTDVNASNLPLQG